MSDERHEIIDMLRTASERTGEAAIAAAEARGYTKAIAALRDEAVLGPFVIAYRERERDRRPIKGYTPSNIVLAEYLESLAGAQP